MTTWTVLGRFCHGLVFSILSLTIAFLQYRSRRILLARRLTWLGAFALCEAVVAWNDLLAPLLVRETLLPPVTRTVLLACGYGWLLAFGIQTWLPKDTSSQNLRWVLVAVFAAWVVPLGITLALTFPNWEMTALTGEILVRYGLALPGGILAGVGMRRQSYQTLEARRESVKTRLRLVEAGLAAFGLLNLVLVPAAPFFPANVFNVNLAPVPASLLRALVGAFWTVGLAATHIAIQTQIEQWIEDVERIQALSADRERISRDLHDGIIQSIYASGLMLETIQQLIATEPEKAEAQLARVMDSLNQTIQDIRRYIFDLRSDMPDDELEPGIRRLLRDFHINTLLETDLHISGEPPRRPLTFERRRHLFQIVRETLTNTSKHAHARGVSVALAYGVEALDLTISDDGVGMEALMLGRGYGLRNIRERARLLDSTLKIESAPGEGVMLHLTIPY
ncbi:MAG: sensor histidine kinase [Anaerolineae bacterium]|nr:sensor histidine kinase [Anaerolineae bacterium]